MTAPASVDAYLAGLPDDQRAALQRLREQILAIVPQAQEVISYGMPGYRVDGHVVAGFAAFRHHLSYFPHSGTVLTELADQVADYTQTKGSLHFSAQKGLPTSLVRALIRARLAASARPAPPPAARRRGGRSSTQ